MATHNTPNYSWVFPQSDEQLNTSNGLLQTMFDAIDNKVYEESNLQALNVASEGGNTGFRIKGFNAANFGDIGNNSIDYSYSGTASSVFGATGDFSFASGYQVQASGSYSNAFGIGTKGINSSSFVLGRYNLGTNGNTLLEVGMGTADGDRKNALEVHDTGSATLPQSTISDIDIKGVKAVITKEYLADYNVPDTLVTGYSDAYTPNLNEVIGFVSTTNNITLPASPLNGFIISFLDVIGDCETNSPTILRNGANIMGLAEDMVVNVNNANFQLIYVSSTTDWRIL